MNWGALLWNIVLWLVAFVLFMLGWFTVRTHDTPWGTPVPPAKGRPKKRQAWWRRAARKIL
jgi:hypothetical protein